MRQPDENPSIGLILCADRDRVDVEYALRGLDKPVGVAEYRLTKQLPPEIADKLPDARQIEWEILRELRSAAREVRAEAALPAAKKKMR